jgi:hypothetical protein
MRAPAEMPASIKMRVCLVPKKMQLPFDPDARGQKPIMELF